MNRIINLQILEGCYAICRLPADAQLPEWAQAGGFASITRNEEELSILCGEEAVPAEIKCEKGWKALKLMGPFKFSEIGILAGILGPLARAGISILAVSTYDTDYVFVKNERLDAARDVLTGAGYSMFGAGLSKGRSPFLV